MRESTAGSAVIFFVLIAALLALVIVAVRAVVRAVGESARDASWSRAGSAAVAARSHSARVSVAMVVVGVVAAFAWPVLVGTIWRILPSGWSPTAGPGLVPLTAGLLMVAVAAVGELTWPQPAGTLRSAPLHRRSLRDIASRRLVRWLVALVAALVAACAAGAATATSGTDGLDRSVTTRHGSQEWSVSPYVGTALATSLVVATALVLVATVLTLRLIVRRPAVVGVGEAWDLALRRRAAGRLLRAVQLTVGLTLAAVLVIEGLAVSRVGLPVLGRIELSLGLAVLVAVVVVTVWGPAPLVGPGPVQPAGTPPTADGPA